MQIADAVLLIGAITGVIGALGLIVTPITVAVINLRAKRRDQTAEQGQPAIDPVLAAETARRRQVERELRAFRKALHRANDALARAGLPLVHPDL